MTRTEPQPRFVVCVNNKDYPASLELRKLYQIVADKAAAKHHQLRVIDESGEDYLYPEEYFVPVQLPQAAQKAMLRAASYFCEIATSRNGQQRAPSLLFARVELHDHCLQGPFRRYLGHRRTHPLT